MLKKCFLIISLITLVYSDLLNISENNKSVYKQISGKWDMAYEVSGNKFTFDINISNAFFDKRVGGYIVKIYESQENIYLCSYDPMSTIEDFDTLFGFFCLKENDYELNSELKNFVTFNINETAQVLIGKMGVVGDDKEVYSYPIIGNKQIENPKENTRVLKLKVGWNLVSLPVATEINKLDFNDTSGIPEVPEKGTYYFDILGNYEDIWVFEKKWIENPETIYKAEGFWIRMSTNSTIIFNGTAYFPDLIGLQSGWHLMGTGSNIKNLMKLKCTECNIENIYVYKNDSWIKNPETISIGDGFWIKKALITNE